MVLGRLRPAERAAIVRRTKPADLQSGQVLYRPGDEIDWIYFPIDAIVSVLADLPSQAGERGEHGEPHGGGIAAPGERGGGVRSIEVATVGKAGFVGVSTLLGGGHTDFHIMTQVPGRALRLPVEDFRRAVSRSRSFRDACLRTARYYMTHIARNTACNATHSLEQRCARWILQAADHSGSELVRLTHHIISQMLGVRRAGVTLALGGLARRGLVRPGRGRIMILDRAGLQAAACECYELGLVDERKYLGEEAARTSGF